MKKRTVSTQTTLEPYGLVRISGEVAKDKDFCPHTEGILGSPFDVQNLIVCEMGFAGWTDITDELDRLEIEKCEEVLIEKFLDDEQAYKDALIDEAIERTRSFARNAYA